MGMGLRVYAIAAFAVVFSTAAIAVELNPSTNFAGSSNVVASERTCDVEVTQILSLDAVRVNVTRCFVSFTHTNSDVTPEFASVTMAVSLRMGSSAIGHRVVGLLGYDEPFPFVDEQCSNLGFPVVATLGTGTAPRQQTVTRAGADLNGTSLVYASSPMDLSTATSTTSTSANVSAAFTVFNVSANFPEFLTVSVVVAVTYAWDGASGDSVQATRSMGCASNSVLPASVVTVPSPGTGYSLFTNSILRSQTVAAGPAVVNGCDQGIPEESGSCRECFGDFLGPQCNMTCPCVANVTGECTSVLNSTGACDSCVTGRFGEQCQSLCSCVANNSLRCFDGPAGFGFCECRPGFGGLLCNECASGHAGPLCLPCSCNASNGVCDSGITGTGRCSRCLPEVPFRNNTETGLAWLYAGSTCSATCPATCPAGLTCTDNVTGAGVCVAIATPVPPTPAPPTSTAVPVTDPPVFTVAPTPAPTSATPTTFIAVALALDISSFNVTTFKVLIAAAAGIEAFNINVERVVAGSVLVRFSLFALGSEATAQEKYAEIDSLLRRNPPALSSLQVQFVSTTTDLTAGATTQAPPTVPTTTAAVTFAPTPAPPAQPVQPPDVPVAAPAESALTTDILVGIGIGVGCVIFFVVIGLLLAKYVRSKQKEEELRKDQEARKRAKELAEAEANDPERATLGDRSGSPVTVSFIKAKRERRHEARIARGEEDDVAAVARNRHAVLGNDSDVDSLASPPVTRLPTTATAVAVKRTPDRYADDPEADPSNFLMSPSFNRSGVMTSMDVDEMEAAERQLAEMESKYTADGGGGGGGGGGAGTNGSGDANESTQGAKPPPALRRVAPLKPVIDFEDVPIVSSADNTPALSRANSHVVASPNTAKSASPTHQQFGGSRRESSPTGMPPLARKSASRNASVVEGASEAGSPPAARGSEIRGEQDADDHQTPAVTPPVEGFTFPTENAGDAAPAGVSADGSAAHSLSSSARGAAPKGPAHEHSVCVSEPTPAATPGATPKMPEGGLPPHRNSAGEVPIAGHPVLDEEDEFSDPLGADRAMDDDDPQLQQDPQAPPSEHEDDADSAEAWPNDVPDADGGHDDAGVLAEEAAGSGDGEGVQQRSPTPVDEADTIPPSAEPPEEPASPQGKAAKLCKLCGFGYTEIDECPVAGESHADMYAQRKRDKKAKKERKQRS